MNANLPLNINKFVKQVLNVISLIVIFKYKINALVLPSKPSKLAKKPRTSCTSCKSTAYFINSDVIIVLLLSAFNSIQNTCIRLLNGTMETHLLALLYIPPLFFYTTYTYKLIEEKGAT